VKVSFIRVLTILLLSRADGMTGVISWLEPTTVGLQSIWDIPSILLSIRVSLFLSQGLYLLLAHRVRRRCLECNSSYPCDSEKNIFNNRNGATVVTILKRRCHHEPDCSTRTGSRDLNSRSTDTELVCICSHTNHVIE
jgi:hypothetical protein